MPNLENGREDWQLIPLKVIASTKQCPGLLPLSSSTILSLVRRGLFPQGQQIYGRTRFWRLSDIKKFSDNIGKDVGKSE